MNKFQPHILPTYPPDNHLIFEEWFAQNFKGCNTDRELLPFFPTSYWVNNNYAQDIVAKKDAQDYIDSLENKKYFVICQYDDGCLIDWKGKDVLEFNMSKKVGIEMPLICQPHPYTFSGDKPYIASFVGSRTHPIRNGIERYINKKDWYISYEPHKIEHYCEVLSQSIFAICPRGYGASSFRTCEATQHGAIPVYLSDIFIECFDLDFNSFGVKHPAEDITTLALRLETMPDIDVATRLNNLKEVYENYYTYEGALKQIIKSLETEFAQRENRA